jgi:hypothetical protein
MPFPGGEPAKGASLRVTPRPLNRLLQTPAGPGDVDASHAGVVGVRGPRDKSRLLQGSDELRHVGRADAEALREVRLSLAVLAPELCQYQVGPRVEPDFSETTGDVGTDLARACEKRECGAVGDHSWHARSPGARGNVNQLSICPKGDAEHRTPVARASGAPRE